MLLVEAFFGLVGALVLVDLAAGLVVFFIVELNATAVGRVNIF